MPAFVLYLHGPYRESDLPFYKSLARGKTRIAVDGGLNFFIRSGVRPDVIVGDFDSLRRDPHKMFPTARVLRFPSEKDKTDTQLAVEYAVAGGADASCYWRRWSASETKEASGFASGIPPTKSYFSTAARAQSSEKREKRYRWSRSLRPFA
jgi:hypothetical protein